MSLLSIVLGGDLYVGPETVLGPIVGSLVAVTLLPTARRLTRDLPRLGPLVAVGVVVGIAVAILPVWVDVWAVDFYDYTPSPLELIPFLGPIAWALVSAVIVWRQAARREEPA